LAVYPEAIIEAILRKPVSPNDESCWVELMGGEEVIRAFR
jgi:hypothetical protein